MQKILFLFNAFSDYFPQIIDEIKKTNKNICYVTFNKTPEFILEEIKNAGANNKFYFLDCISSQIFNKNKQENNIHILEPSNFNQIKEIISKVVKKGYNFVIIDSLSNAISYNSKIDVSFISNFIKNLELDLKNKEGDFLFVCYANDIENYSLDSIVPQFNKFIKIGSDTI